MRLGVDRGICVGAGMCALSAPEVFDQDPEDGTVVLLDATPPEGSHELVDEAIILCPSGAISVLTGRAA